MKFVRSIRVSAEEDFDSLHPEAYTYETIGGNNSQAALTELVQEKPDLATDIRYTKRMVSVYRDLTTEQAQMLAVKHNRQQSFVHTTTQDKVRLVQYSASQFDYTVVKQRSAGSRKLPAIFCYFVSSFL